MHRGNAYLAAGQLDKARADYEGALRQKPKDMWSLYGLGYIKKRQGDENGGDADVAAAKAINSNIAKAFDLRGIK